MMPALELWQRPVSYAAIGATQAGDLLYYPPEGYRPFQQRSRIGHGDVRWEYAWTSLMSWGVQRNSGFTVAVEPSPPEVGELSYVPVSFDESGAPVAPAVVDDATEAVFGPDGEPFLAPGDTAWLRFPGPLPMRAPVRVVYLIDEPNRKGFAYGTLPGHPESGEEAFIVDQTDDGSVWLEIRSISRPSSPFWWAMYPFLRLFQAAFMRRYFRSLSVPIPSGTGGSDAG
jgi:uncharacterized protein (UPF0548 family)